MSRSRGKTVVEFALLALLWFLGCARSIRAQVSPVLNPIRSVPQANASFIADLQTFLQNEAYQERAELSQPFIVSGCLGATAAGLSHTPTSCTAYPGGYRVTETGAITYANASTCTVAVNIGTVGTPGGNWVRVSGTHYLTDCVDSAPAAAPASSITVMVVTTSGGAITAVTDLRVLSPPSQLQSGVAYGRLGGYFVTGPVGVSNTTTESNLVALGTVGGASRVGSAVAITLGGTAKASVPGNQTLIRVYVGTQTTQVQVCAVNVSQFLPASTTEPLWITLKLYEQTPTSIFCDGTATTGAAAASNVVAFDILTALGFSLSGPVYLKVTAQLGTASVNDVVFLNQFNADLTY